MSMCGYFTQRIRKIGRMFGNTSALFLAATLLVMGKKSVMETQKKLWHPFSRPRHD